MRRSLSGLRPPGLVAALGVVALVSYGVAYYSYGVLLEPHGTGWSETGLAAVFSVVLVVGGVGCVPGGRLADRFGTRPAFLLAATLGAGLMFASSFADRLLLFGGLYAVGAGAIGALAFYHVTQSATVRISGPRATSGLVWLTLFGALASPIFLPVTAALSSAVGWRQTVRLEAVLVAVVLLLGGLLVSVSDETSRDPAERAGARAAIGRAWRTAGFKRWVLASLIAGAAVDVVLVFQVTIMVSAGLSFGLAATIGGMRGLAQLAGRIGLGPVLRAFGTRVTVIASFLLGGVGVLFLLLAGNVVAAIVFCGLAGASFGVISTLQGIYTHELVGDADLGLLLGTQQAIFAGGSALGPVLAGVLITATGSDTTVVILASVGFVAAAATMILPRPRPGLRVPAPAVGPRCC